MSVASPRTIDWEFVVARNAQRLLVLVGEIVALAARFDTVTCPRARRAVRRAVLQLLRPAEGAARRLILIAALQLPRRDVAGRNPCAPRRGHPLPDFSLFARTGPSVRFALSDGRKHFEALRGLAARRAGRCGPRISVAGFGPPPVASGSSRAMGESGPDACAGVERRVAALKAAVDDLPGEARRMARLLARRAALVGASARRAPLRPGLPPGLPRRAIARADLFLKDMHTLALMRQRTAPPP